MLGSAAELGVVTTLLERFEKRRLPRVLAIKARVDRGARFIDPDIDYLQMLLCDMVRDQHHFDSTQELRDLYTRIVRLYTDVASKGLENEGRD